MKLYPYQQNCLLAIESDPSHSQLISMPTGTGKTITFLSCAKFKNKKCLILVHRNELLEQTFEKAKKVGYLESDISIINAEIKSEIKKLTIAMVPTLTRNLNRYSPDDIEMMIIDEAHHSTAESYRKIIDYFNIFEHKKTLLGFTATPLRSDSMILSSLYHSHSFKMTLSEATQNGYICPVHGMRVDIKKGLENVKNEGGDYKIEDLDKIMNCNSINQLVADRCEHLYKIPAIIFCTSVDHATKINDLLQQRSRKSAVVSYKTPKKDLEKILESLKKGELEFITNAVKLSEGFDFPAIQSVILARPTRSPVLYKQMIGRGLRNHPHKYDCFVLEFCGNDPSMICWEDIDENCTFQCSSENEKKDRNEALSIYKSKFGPNVVVLDVRLSPFKFYECKIQRLVKFRNTFRFAPFQEGFIVFEFRSFKNNSNISLDLMGKELYVHVCFWKEPYKSFYVWDGGGPLWGARSNKDMTYAGWRYEELNKQCHFYLEKQRGFSKWYPSEEEPMTKKQHKFFHHPLKMSARKAEMFLEDCSIKIAIKKFWVDQKMPEVNATEEDKNSSDGYWFNDIQKTLEDKNQLYILPGKY